MVVDRLVEPGRRLPAAAEGVSADGPALARRVQPGLRRLERVRRLKLDAETRLAGAHAEKDVSMRAYDAAFPETAALIASYLRLTGRSELADELQPSRQEPGLLHKQVQRRRATNAGRKRAKAVKSAS